MGPGNLEEMIKKVATSSSVHIQNAKLRFPKNIGNMFLVWKKFFTRGFYVI